MDLDFELDWAENGSAPELLGLHRGDTVSAGQFLAWFAGKDEAQAAAAAAQMERDGISLSVADFTPIVKNSAGAERLALEEKLAAEGRLETDLPREDVLALTIGEYRRFSPISDGKAQELWQEFRAGKQDRMETLTQGCLGRVLDAAGEFAGKGVLLQDLLQEGCLALWQTVTDESAGEFLPEAMWRVRQAMARQVVLQALGDDIGRNLAQDLENYHKTELALLQKLGRNPVGEEIAQAMGLTPEQTETLGKMAQEAAQMEKRKPKAPQEDADAERPVEDSAYFALRSRVEELLSGLSPEDREIVSLRFGLLGQPPMTAEEVGRKLRLPAQEVLERETAALAALRNGK